MTRHTRPTPTSRRAALRLLLGSAGLGASGFLRGPEPVLAQPAGWFAARSPKPAVFPKGSIIRTLAKDIPPDALPNGATMFHEHIGGTFEPSQPLKPTDIPPGPVALRQESEYIDLMVEELKMARADGVSCIVDSASSGRRSDRTVANLTQISAKSAVSVVLGGGYYQDLALSARYPPEIVKIAEDALVEEFVRDARSQRWGALGEIASSQQMQPEERKVVRAIGRAHQRTNLPVFTHTPHEGCPSCALEQLDVLQQVGVDPRRVCIGHLSTIKPDAEPLAQTAKALAKRGAFLGFDTVGHQMLRSQIPEAHKVRYVLAVLEAGFEDHLLLSADSTPVPQLKANWGQGFASVVTQFVPKLRYAGVSDAILHKILVDNSRRFLAFVPPASS